MQEKLKVRKYDPVFVRYLFVFHFRLDFTGISAPYEAPENPEIHINTAETDVEESVRIITQYLLNKGYISETSL